MARELRLERRLTVLETVSLPLTDSRIEMVALTRLELVPNNLGDCDSVLLNYKAMKLIAAVAGFHCSVCFHKQALVHESSHIPLL